MQPRNFAVVAICACRIIWVRHKNHARLVGHQRQQGIDIGAIILVRRDNHIGRRFARRNVIDRETITDINDIIACTRIAHGDKVQQFIRTRAADDLVAINIICRAQCCAQSGAGGVRISGQRRAFIHQRRRSVGTTPQGVFVRR